MNKEFWVCGQWKGADKPWEFQGLFDSEHLAIKACVTDDYFIMPVELNKELPQETMRMPGGYYPRLETKEQAAKRHEEAA